jgi:hypothetical protein
MKQMPSNRGGASIDSGDSGIFLTCDIGKESKCIAEALDLFTQVSNTDAFRPFWPGRQYFVH